MVYNCTPNETQPTVYSHINGSPEEIRDRYCVSELCKGWPVYRDASEWNNYRDIFAEKDAYIWTSKPAQPSTPPFRPPNQSSNTHFCFTAWSGGLSIDDFIEVSKKGRAKGDFIMHRENGTLVDVNPSTSRAVGKMKATITQRFIFESDISVDIECDCRFIFFCKKEPTSTSGSTPVWKTQYVKLFYEKDKMIPVDGKTVPTFDKAELKKYPVGYQFLGAAQATLGHMILDDLPTMDNKGFFDMYEAMEQWLQGKAVGKILGVPGH